MSEIVKIEAVAYPAALGAGVAYSLYGKQPVPLAVGAVAGYFAYGPINGAALGLPLPPFITLAAPEILAGGIIGYNLYNGSLVYAAGGAAVGIAVKYALAVLLAREMGAKL